MRDHTSITTETPAENALAKAIKDAGATAAAAADPRVDLMFTQPALVSYSHPEQEGQQ